MIHEAKKPIFKNGLKRMLVFWQLYKYTLEDIRTSEYAKELAAIAKENKNKNFQDIRVVAADQINFMSSTMFKLKRVMHSDTWNTLMRELSSEDVHEINLLIDEVVEMELHEIEKLVKSIQDDRVKNNTPKDKNISNPE